MSFSSFWFSHEHTSIWWRIRRKKKRRRRNNNEEGNYDYDHNNDERELIYMLDLLRQ